MLFASSVVLFESGRHLSHALESPFVYISQPHVVASPGNCLLLDDVVAILAQ